MSLWGCVVREGVPEVLSLEGKELDIIHAVLLGDAGACNVKATYCEGDTSDRCDDESKEGGDNTKATMSCVIARLTPKMPNARMHIVLANDTTLEVTGSAGASVQLVGNIRTQGEGDSELMEAIRSKFGVTDDSDEDEESDESGEGEVKVGDSDDSDSEDDDEEFPVGPNGLHPQVEEIDEEDGEPSPSVAAAAASVETTAEEPRHNNVGSGGNRESSKDGFVRLVAVGDGESNARVPTSFGAQMRQKRAASGDTAGAAMDGQNPTAEIGAKKKARKRRKKPTQTSDSGGDNNREEPQPLGIKKQLKAGVSIDIISLGAVDGAVRPLAAVGKQVEITYEGKLKESGKVFDNGTLSFVLGKGETIAGLDVGIRGMMVSEKRRISVPCRMGYGAKGMPPAIPPEADLEFVVTLLKIR